MNLRDFAPRSTHPSLPSAQRLRRHQVYQLLPRSTDAVSNALLPASASCVDRGAQPRRQIGRNSGSKNLRVSIDHFFGFVDGLGIPMPAASQAAGQDVS